MTEFQRPPTAQEAVLAELRTRILRGDLPPGTPLRQEVLAASLGVSRVPIREALRMLESEGHVVYAAHRGSRVADLGLADVEEIYALRALIEDHLAMQSIAAMGDKDVAAVRRAHAALEAAESAVLAAAGSAGAPSHGGGPARASIPDLPATGDGPRGTGGPQADLAAANRAFHWAILRPSPRADRILTTLWDASDAARARWFADPANVARGAEDHRAILAATQARDGERVVGLLAAHRASAITALRAVLPS